MIRCLEEMRVDGVATNKEVLMNILKDSGFLTGNYTTNFFDHRKMFE
jgi:acetyl-CoA carboxylase biotin carboxylase subunit